MKKLLPFTLLVFILIALSCQDKTSKDTDLHFQAREFLSAYTQGMIDPYDDIIFRIQSSKKVEFNEMKQSITTEPAFDFDLRFDSLRNEVIIDPLNPLERGQTYLVSFPLRKWFSDAPRKTFSTEVRVFHQHLDVSRKGLLLTGDERFLEVDVFTSLPETNSSISTIFNYPKNKIDVTEVTNRHFFVRLKTGENDQEKIPWNGSVIGSEDSGELAVYKFDPTKFEVVNTHFNRTSQ